jgi:hypothetical protein
VNSFSIIVPAHDDILATARTLSNLVHQGGITLPEWEIIVVSDGPNKMIRNVVRTAQKTAIEEKQPVVLRYLWTKHFQGTGNPGRALGLKAATKDWVMFIDSGTSVIHHAMFMIDFALRQTPDAEMVVWDIIQLVDPVPFVWFSYHMKKALENEKIGYWIPGVGAAVRRELAQQVEWPNVSVSDWAYWCAVWKLLKRPIQLAIVSHPLVIPYAAYDFKRFRALSGPKAWDTSNFDLDFEEAYPEAAGVTDGSKSVPDGTRQNNSG